MRDPTVESLEEQYDTPRQPPADGSRRFAITAISLTIGVWIVLPLLVTFRSRADRC